MTRDDVSEKFLYGHSLGTTLVTSLRNPLWRDGAMTNRRSPLHQLADHLAFVARSTEGRELFGDLTNAGLRPSGAVDLLGLLDPDKVTSALQRAEVVEWLAQWAHDDETSAVTVLALLEPELVVVVRRLIRSGIPPNEAEGETLAAAWEVVTGPSKAKGAARLETIWTRARTASGLRRSCPVEVVAFPEGFDAADPKSDPPEGRSTLLAAAEAAGVLTPRQLVIVASTRVEGCSVAEVAKALGLAPKTVYKDRDRAENALAAFARSYDDSKSGR
jgi:DNA-directed RNA polymerase specialized sigma24 family protein